MRPQQHGPVDHDPIARPQSRNHGNMIIQTARRLDLDRLEPPPSLERIGRSIRVAGHRISLFHVLDAIFDGTSAARMREMFPTIPAWKLDEVCSFCEQNIALNKSTMGDNQVNFYIRTRPDNLFQASTRRGFGQDQWHTFAVEVTRKTMSPRCSILGSGTSLTSTWPGRWNTRALISPPFLRHCPLCPSAQNNNAARDEIRWAKIQ